MQASEKNHFLIDGFPRNKDNVGRWQSSDPMRSLSGLQWIDSTDGWIVRTRESTPKYRCLQGRRCRWSLITSSFTVRMCLGLWRSPSRDHWPRLQQAIEIISSRSVLLFERFEYISVHSSGKHQSLIIPKSDQIEFSFPFSCLRSMRDTCRTTFVFFSLSSDKDAPSL